MLAQQQSIKICEAEPDRNTRKKYMNPQFQLKNLTSLSEMDKSIKQKNRNDITELNSTINQVVIIDTYRTFHPATGEYIILFSSSYETIIDSSLSRLQNTP